MPAGNEKERLPGLVEWIRIGDKEAVIKTAEAQSELRISELRLLFSWADWAGPGGREWFDYFVPTLAKHCRLVPNLFYTPPHLARPTAQNKKFTSNPPEDLKDFADFTLEMIKLYGHCFDWVQLWNEANWKPYWNWDLDPDWKLFAEMVSEAADAAHSQGKKAALGGISPYEPEWITILDDLGALKKMDAVGMHYSPSWKNQRRRWFGWDTELKAAKAHLKGIDYKGELWISEAGFATNGKDEAETQRLYSEQISYFDETRHARAEKIFWYSLFDQAESHATDDVLTETTEAPQAEAYYFGLITADGRKKPLYEHWKKLAETAA